jgi:hypothetical protein
MGGIVTNYITYIPCICHLNAGKREKVTAEMKRAARKLREAEREEKAASQRREKEEIFEVCGACH